MTQTIITGGMASGKSFQLEQEKAALSRIATKQYKLDKDFGDKVECFYHECEKVFGRSPTHLFITLKQYENLKQGFNRLNISIINPNVIYWGDSTEVVINNAINEPCFLVKYPNPKKDGFVFAKIYILSDMLDFNN